MRALVALLVLANLLFFALAQGWLQPVAGLAGDHEREPQRLAGQLNADAVRIVATPAQAASEAASDIEVVPGAAPDAASGATDCAAAEATGPGGGGCPPAR